LIRSTQKNPGAGEPHHFFAQGLRNGHAASHLRPSLDLAWNASTRVLAGRGRKPANGLQLFTMAGRWPQQNLLFATTRLCKLERLCVVRAGCGIMKNQRRNMSFDRYLTKSTSGWLPTRLAASLIDNRVFFARQPIIQTITRQ
jgi:hypothetical protein